MSRKISTKNRTRLEYSLETWLKAALEALVARKGNGGGASELITGALLATYPELKRAQPPERA